MKSRFKKMDAGSGGRSQIVAGRSCHRDAKRSHVDPFPASGAVAGWEKTERHARVCRQGSLAIHRRRRRAVHRGRRRFHLHLGLQIPGPVGGGRRCAHHGGCRGARKILENGTAERTPKPFSWAMPALPTRRASCSAKGHTWCASLPMSPRPIRRRRCWRWRMAWKRNSRPAGRRPLTSDDEHEARNA